MLLSSRIKDVAESITFKLNERAISLNESGHHIYNLTAGQLPFKPHPGFIDTINSELHFLKSFQYSPIMGFKELREKLVRYFEKQRNIDLSSIKGLEFDCVVSNGAKHSIYNAVGSIVDPGDEVIILSPYWIAYPEIVKLWGGVPLMVPSRPFDAFIPPMEEIKKILTKRTKAIIINSPNNPSGICYPHEWMEDFSRLISDFPNLTVISDEIYNELYYFDPKPVYFYQINPELLKRTIIIDGISKSFASTGLRIGFAFGNKEYVNAQAKLQSQTTSGANSLVQRALLNFDFNKIDEYLIPIRAHLRKNANSLREIFKSKNLSHCWYQTNSAFYFLIDFKQTPVFLRFNGKDDPQAEEKDYAGLICEDLLEKTGIAIVPGSDFGVKNSGRISLVLEEGAFIEAITKLSQFLINQ